MFWANFSNGGERLALATANGIELRDASTFEILESIKSSESSPVRVQFLPNDDQLLVTYLAGTVHIIDSESGELVTSFEHPSRVIWSMLDDEARIVVTSALDGGVRVWDAQTGDLHQELYPNQPIESDYSTNDTIASAGSETVYNLAVSPTGDAIATGGDDSTLIWDPSSGELLANFPFRSYTYRDVEFSPDGKMLAVAGAGRHDEVTLWNMDSGEQLTTFAPRFSDEENTIVDISFHPDGDKLLVLLKNGVVEVWSVPARVTVQWLSTGFEQRGRGLNGKIETSPNGEQFVVFTNACYWDLCYGSSAKLIDLATGELEVYGDDIPSGIAFVGDSDMLVSLYKTGQFKAWTPQKGFHELTEPRGRSSFYLSIAHSPDGAWVVAGRDDGALEIWDANDLSTSIELRAHSDSIWDVEFSADGTLMASGSSDAYAKVWSVGDWSRLHQFFHSRYDGANSVAFYDDNSYLAVGTDERIEFHPLSSEGTHFTRSATEYFISGLELTKDGLMAIANNYDDYVLVRDIESSIVRQRLAHEDSYALALSDDESVIITLGGNKLMLWDIHTGEQLAEIELGDFTESIAMSSDGETLATLSINGVIKVWQVLGP